MHEVEEREELEFAPPATVLQATVLQASVGRRLGEGPDHDPQPDAQLEDQSASVQIRYFDESDRRAAIPRMQPAGQMQIANDLASARTPDERTRLVNGMLSLIGFSDVAYLMARLGAQQQFERVYFSRSFRSDHFGPRYFEAGQHRRDPRLRAVLSSSTPHVWDVRSLGDAWRRTEPFSTMRVAIDQLRAHGAGSGVMFSVPVMQTRLRSIIAFASPVEHANWMTDDVIAQALALGLSIHQHCSPVVRALERDDAGLTEVQIRILRLVAAGLSDKAIAQRMQTTPHNVDYHLRGLRQKCGVNSRVQLAFLAGRLLGP